MKNRILVKGAMPVCFIVMREGEAVAGDNFCVLQGFNESNAAETGDGYKWWKDGEREYSWVIPPSHVGERRMLSDLAEQEPSNFRWDESGGVLTWRASFLPDSATPPIR